MSKTKVRHIDLQFAGTTNAELCQIAREYEEWEDTAAVAEDALLRLKSPKGTPSSMIVTALGAFREIAAREGLLTPPGAQATLWELLTDLYEEDEARLFLAAPQPSITGHDMPPSQMLAMGMDMKPILDWIEGCEAMVAT